MTAPQPLVSQRRREPPPVGNGAVLMRFALRLVLMGLIASFGAQGFGRTFCVVTFYTSILCIAFAVVRREAAGGPRLTHWDEAAGFVFASLLAFRLSF